MNDRAAAWAWRLVRRGCTANQGRVVVVVAPGSSAAGVVVSSASKRCGISRGDGGSRMCQWVGAVRREDQGRRWRRQAWQRRVLGRGIRRGVRNESLNGTQRGGAIGVNLLVRKYALDYRFI